MGIKEKRHPEGKIDLHLVPYSMVMEEDLRLIVNNYIIKKYGKEFAFKEYHHILIVDMGECD